MAVDRQFRWARVLFAATCCAYVVIQLVVVAAWPVEYQFLHHTISDLGFTECVVEQRPGGVLASCSPRHDLFNIGSAACAVVLAVAGLGVRSAIESTWTRGSYVALWVLSTASGVATSAIPGNVDLALHTLVALPQFLCQLILLILVAWTMRETAPRFATTAAIAATVTAAGCVAFVFALAGIGPVGLTERLALESIYVWATSAALLGPGHPSP